MNNRKKEVTCYPMLVSMKTPALDALLCVLTQESYGSAHDCCVNSLFLPKTSAEVGTLIHLNRDVSVLLLKKCWDAVFAKTIFKKKKKNTLFNTVLCLSIQEFFCFAYFLLVQVFLRWVPIYSELEITWHLCFWNPGRVTVLFWVNCASWLTLGKAVSGFCFCPSPLLHCGLLKQFAYLVSQQRGLRGFPHSQGRSLKSLPILGTTKGLQAYGMWASVIPNIDHAAAQETFKMAKLKQWNLGCT